VVGKGGRRINTVQTMYTQYVNAKMVLVETVPGIRGGGMKDSVGGGEFKYDTFDTL
jgi:hypothetical protein